MLLSRDYTILVTCKCAPMDVALAQMKIIEAGREINNFELGSNHLTFN